MPGDAECRLFGHLYSSPRGSSVPPRAAGTKEGTQRPLLGAAKLAHSLELAGVRQRKLERGNPNSPYGVTGADALIVGYLLAVERQLQDWMSSSSAVRQQTKRSSQ